MSLAIVGQIIVGIVGLITVIINQKPDPYKKSQEGRDAVSNGDVDAVTARIDRLLYKTDNIARSKGDIDTAKRLSDFFRKGVVPK